MGWEKSLGERETNTQKERNGEKNRNQRKDSKAFNQLLRSESWGHIVIVGVAWRELGACIESWGHMVRVRGTW